MEPSSTSSAIGGIASSAPFESTVDAPEQLAASVAAPMPTIRPRIAFIPLSEDLPRRDVVLCPCFEIASIVAFVQLAR
jgi:hypothetical protein